MTPETNYSWLWRHQTTLKKPKNPKAFLKNSMFVHHWIFKTENLEKTCAETSLKSVQSNLGNLEYGINILRTWSGNLGIFISIKGTLMRIFFCASVRPKESLPPTHPPLPTPTHPPLPPPSWPHIWPPRRRWVGRVSISQEGGVGGWAVGREVVGWGNRQAGSGGTPLQEND